MAGEIKFGNQTSFKPKMASIEAVIVRANGKREDLGVIAYYHKNPFKMLLWRVKQLIKGVL